MLIKNAINVQVCNATIYSKSVKFFACEFVTRWLMLYSNAKSAIHAGKSEAEKLVISHKYLQMQYAAFEKLADKLWQPCIIGPWHSFSKPPKTCTSLRSQSGATTSRSRRVSDGSHRHYAVDHHQ